MLSQLPINLNSVDSRNIDAEILRAGIIAELDAVSFYEQMAAKTEDSTIRKVLLDIADEEKVHVGEFQALLVARDKEQARALEEGSDEIEEITKG